MKRDPELIRALLVAIEDNPQSMSMFEDFESVSANPDLAIGHIKLLVDAGYLHAEKSHKGITMGWRLTWDGHEFLDATRDPEVWRKTKDGAKKVGSASIPFMLEIATGYVKARAIEMGIPIA